MRTLALGRFALSTSVAAALLAGCGGSQPPIGAPGAMPVSARDASSYRVAHRFGCSHGAAYPVASLLAVNGTLYGTTPGADDVCPRKDSGLGTVFTISPSGVTKELYHFKGGSDGAHPSAGALIDVNGTLYGTTDSGGGTGCESGRGCGTVYSLSPSGAETVIYSFQGSPDDGAAPYGLVALNGTLYGTTVLGGPSPPYCNITGESPGCGTVFSVTTSGSEKVLHFFENNPDGANPQSALTAVNGTLYGITYDGGGPKCRRESCPEGYGTLYSITTSGSEKVVHKFEYDEGPFPTGGLLDVGGTLYGTTGGTYSPCCGTVYQVSTRGVFSVLYRFQGARDGAFPLGGLISENGALYGTTQEGGVDCAPYSHGCGTIFTVTTSGQESVLHRFRGNPNGRDPIAGLAYVNGTFYGTTALGGLSLCGSYGCGIIYTFSQ
jgi:uncharacterized repeat protein (TIGR03803 family)